jgi:DNA-binding beta-propeller fold protein YncE
MYVLSRSLFLAVLAVLATSLVACGGGSEIANEGTQVALAQTEVALSKTQVAIEKSGLAATRVALASPSSQNDLTPTPSPPHTRESATPTTPVRSPGNPTRTPTPLPTPRSCNQAEEQGVELYTERQFAASLSLFNKAVELCSGNDSDLRQSLYNRGLAYFQLQDYFSVIQDMTNVINSAANDVDAGAALFIRGLTNYRLHKIDQARGDFERVRRANLGKSLGDEAAAQVSFLDNKSVSLSGQPNYMQLNQRTGFLYFRSNFVTLVAADTYNSKLAGTVDLGEIGHDLTMNNDIAIDESQNIVYTFSGIPELLVIDGGSNRIKSTVPLLVPQESYVTSVEFSPINRRLYIGVYTEEAESRTTKIVTVNADNLEVAVSIDLAGIGGEGEMAIDLDQKLLYYLGYRVIAIINLENDEIVRTIPVDAYSHNRLEVHYQTGLIYYLGGNAVHALDPRTGVTSSLVVDSSLSDFAIDQSRNLLYVTDYDDDNVSVFDLNTDQLVKTYWNTDTGVYFDGPSSIAIDEKTGTAFVLSGSRIAALPLEGGIQILGNRVPASAVGRTYLCRSTEEGLIISHNGSYAPYGPEAMFVFGKGFFPSSFDEESKANLKEIFNASPGVKIWPYRADASSWPPSRPYETIIGEFPQYGEVFPPTDNVGVFAVLGRYFFAATEPLPVYIGGIETEIYLVGVFSTKECDAH